MASRHTLTGDVIKGAVAGAAATWLMNKATTWMYERESDDAKEHENQARGGQTAYARAAARAAGMAGYELTEERQNQYGRAIHWGTGIAAGIMYAVARRRWPRARAGLGMPFGVSYFLVLDELLNPLLGLTPGPGAFPWQTHARGLGGHVALGLTTELVLDGLDRVA